MEPFRADPHSRHGEIRVDDVHVVADGAAVVGVRDGAGDEFVGDLQLGQADRRAVGVDGLHQLDRAEHVPERGGVLPVAHLGAAGVLRVQDDVRRGHGQPCEPFRCVGLFVLRGMLLLVH